MIGPVRLGASVGSSKRGRCRIAELAVPVATGAFGRGRARPAGLLRGTALGWAAAAPPERGTL